jgi:succinate dehydrogenase / fumarate reductase flavoprotein subunit
MQGLADGYFVIPYTIGDYLAGTTRKKITTDHDAFKQSQHDVQANITKLINMNGSRTVTDFHRALGAILWDKVGMARTKEGLTEAIGQIQQLREEFWQDVKLVGTADNVNPELEHAGRVADYMEFGETAGAGRTGSQRKLWRPLPRRVSNARWRSAAQR